MVDLPEAVRLMWGLAGEGARGPKRGLTIAQIVDAAIAVADGEGFAALSMARVAKQLGFTTMSLYRYVDSKDTLVDLVMDQAMGPPPPLAADHGWRRALEDWAWAEFHAIMRHPWWLDIPLVRPPMGPNQMGWLEAGLRAMAATRLPEPLKLQLVLNLSLYVLGRMRLMVQMAATQQDGEVDFAAVMSAVLDVERFPSVAAALRGQAFVDDDIEFDNGDFGFALARLLDGYEKLVDAY